MSFAKPFKSPALAFDLFGSPNRTKLEPLGRGYEAFIKYTLDNSGPFRTKINAP